MRLRRRGERIAMPPLHPYHPGAERPEGLLRDLVQRRSPRRVVEQHGAASSRSRPGGASKVDCQCQKVRSPSVTRLSSSVATCRRRGTREPVGRTWW
jgi:hypothetical protein